MFLAKKIIAANIIVGGAVAAAVGTVVGTAAVAYALSDPDCRDKLKDCADKLRDCTNKMCSRSSNADKTEVV